MANPFILPIEKFLATIVLSLLTLITPRSAVYKFNASITR